MDGEPGGLGGTSNNSGTDRTDSSAGLDAADISSFNNALENAGFGNAKTNPEIGNHPGTQGPAIGGSDYAARGSAGWSVTFSDIQDTAIGRIAGEAAKGFQQGWGNRQLGLGPETVQALRDWNVFRNPNHSHTVFHHINEALIGGSAVAIDGVARGFTSAIYGTADALGQTNDELGGTEGSRLARDLKAMPDAFAGMGGLLTRSSRITTTLRSGQMTEEARITAQIAKQNFDDALKEARQYELGFDRSSIGMAGGNVRIGKSGGVDGLTLVNPRSLISRQGPSEMTGNHVKRLTSNMRKNGFDASEPIEVADVNGRLLIVDGHHRAAAAIRAGIDQVPIKQISITPEQAAQLAAEAAEATAEYALRRR